MSPGDAVRCAPLAPAQLRQVFFPHDAQLNFDLKAIHQVLSVGRLQRRKVPREELHEDAAACRCIFRSREKAYIR